MCAQPPGLPAPSHQPETNFPHQSHSKISPPVTQGSHPPLPTEAGLQLSPQPPHQCVTLPGSYPWAISPINSSSGHFPHCPISWLPCAAHLKTVVHTCFQLISLILSHTRSDPGHRLPPRGQGQRWVLTPPLSVLALTHSITPPPLPSRPASFPLLVPLLPGFLP